MSSTRLMKVKIIEGDLLGQKVDCIVNAWNRNIIPWWLLLPQGVSGAIKKQGGYQPFRELARSGPIPLGGAVLTSPGTLPFKAIIHVAGINMLWRSSEKSIRDSVLNALALAKQHGFKSIAFPLIGAGAGGGKPELVLKIMTEEASLTDFDGEVYIVVRNARGCYCGMLDTKILEQKNIPKGYCGLCDECGRPGHLRHGYSVPITQVWCDSCWRSHVRRVLKRYTVIITVVIVVFLLLILRRSGS